MQFHISAADGVPLYQQIVNQVKLMLASGRLEPGDELPPIRVLAQQLLINPNTVARAYRELETEGVLTKRQGAGTYVSDQGSPLARRERLRLVRGSVDALLAQALQLDIDTEEVIDIIRKRDKELMDRGNKTNDKQESER
ncbi:MAG TPA: GntR family transcriptional regulator [Candidatus Hydrogenedentes bacterium]|nr:GntR family transcriptional regulator [Candidatus Hydrogenedentota bacterium]HQH52252.1 GntR family transcriptional regulator [Candidatus Hydrogenedentota bacterium]HQM50906.1 GntR family transcriptional regulator [Candidatus Hydrogenedentota bacterium]